MLRSDTRENLAGVSGDKAAVQRLTKSMLGAIREVHKAGCVHRDVKPDNMLLASAGGLLSKGAKVPNTTRVRQLVYC
jgi:serine/threonine protein kinase